MPTTSFPSALGTCGISWSGTQITGFSLPPTPDSDDAAPAFVSEVVTRVQNHLGGQMEAFTDLPFAWDTVTPFQQAVYQAALAIGPGQTSSYGELARAIGQPVSAARTIGTALGQNPWPLLVPCHRFLAADGHMTGFSAPGGIKTKLRLLALEGSQLFAE